MLHGDTNGQTATIQVVGAVDEHDQELNNCKKTLCKK